MKPNLFARCLAAACLVLFGEAAGAQMPGDSPMPMPASSPMPMGTPPPAFWATPAASPAPPVPAGNSQIPEMTLQVARAQPVASQEIITRLQIFLDQQDFGPGKIDGRWGEFTGKGLMHYQRAHKLPETGRVDASIPLESVYPIYTMYKITPVDEKSVRPTPSKPAEQAKMKYMGYRSLLEFLEERFHSDPNFLRKINPGLKMDSLKAGETVRVPNVAPFKLEDCREIAHLPDQPQFANRTLYISPKDKMLDLYDGRNLIAAFPITPGSTSLPAPPGVWMILGIAEMPWFRWDEMMLYHGKRSKDYFDIPAGPRNPVGVIWMALDKPGIGIHGTATPETIGRSGSHGCIRLANWDAIRLSGMVTNNMTVVIE
jgi:lipoprotein-anchoring transpeptidase ErfK/SrfK